MRAFWRLLGIWAVLAALLPNPSAAQISGGVQQKGTVTANNCTKWAGPGVIQDSGSTCGGGGSGSPGGSPTQVQYNAAGSFGGISGATSDGTTITLVAPILGTPASVTLTNGTGLPIGGTTGWGTGVAAALANPINATSGFATYVLGSSSAFGLVKVDNTTITASAGVIIAVNTGTVTSVATACGPTGGTITTSGTIKSAVIASSQTGANYAFQDSDCSKLINLSNASAQAPTLAAAGSGSLLFSAGGFVSVCNQGAGVQTLTPTTSTIGGAATYPLGAGSAKSPTCITVVSDGTNYQVVPDALVGTATGALKASTGGVISQAACADLSNGATGCSTATGTSGATLPLLNGTNTWSGAQTFGNVFGTINAQSGTTYTLASTDCGKTVVITNASAITLTTLNSIPAGCAIAVEQGGAGQITVANGSGATLTSAHSYTKTFNAAGAIIGLFVDTNSGTNAHFVLTGDGA